MEQKIKVLYLQGRPRPHPMHESMALSVNAEPRFVDEKIRWQDKEFGTFGKLFAWLWNSFFMSYANKYDVVLVDGLHFSPIIARKLGIISREKKILAHMGSHTLYFLYEKKFGAINTSIQKWLLKSYDGFFCEGNMAKKLIEELTPDSKAKLKVTFLGPSNNRLYKLRQCIPSLDSNTIVTIAAGSSNFRIYYKGLDIMIKAFALASEKNKDLKFYILGYWDDASIKQLKKDLTKEISDNVVFTGNVENIEQYFNIASLYLHISRGDAFPTSTIEAMHAGLPTLVSKWTGTSEIVCNVDDSFITDFSEINVAERISNYINLSFEDKEKLSRKFRLVSQNYTENIANIHYKKVFNDMLFDLNLISDANKLK